MRLRFSRKKKVENREQRIEHLCSWHSFFTILPRNIGTDEKSPEYAFLEYIERRAKDGKRIWATFPHDWEYRCPRDSLMENLKFKGKQE